jgi:hypothetical protein
MDDMASLEIKDPVRRRSLHLPPGMTRTIIGLLTFVAACGDGGGPSSGFFTGNWNRQQWVGEAAAVLVPSAGSDTLHIAAGRHRRTRQDPDESVLLKIRFSGPGEYPLSGEAVTFLVLVGGDQVVASYTGVSPDAGTLKVDTYDPVKGVVKGSVTFEAVSSGNDQPYGPRGQFSDGRFEATLHVE